METHILSLYLYFLRGKKSLKRVKKNERKATHPISISNQVAQVALLKPDAVAAGIKRKHYGVERKGLAKEEEGASVGKMWSELSSTRKQWLKSCQLTLEAKLFDICMGFLYCMNVSI